jgi:large subunit ribosomal protein L35Ae
MLGFQRSIHSQNPNVALLKLEGVDTRDATSFYLGKRVAYVYRAPKAVKGTKVRVVWGKIARPHGNSGVVRARFVKNLNPRSMGATIRVMLYPSNV